LITLEIEAETKPSITLERGGMNFAGSSPHEYRTKLSQKYNLTYLMDEIMEYTQFILKD